MSKEDLPLLRIAVISTPRSGNTWMRAMLAELYDLESIGLHSAAEIDWANLPRRCVIQIHWPPWPRFVKRLKRNGFRVVVLARHPLDVLMSWLNYSYYVHQEGYCTGAGICKECAIVGTLPRSEAFLNYLRSDEGRMLLSFSPAWWFRAGVLQVRYEDLMADPALVLGRLVEQIGEAPGRSIAEVVEANSIRKKKPSQDAWQYHFWQGQPGLWRQMLTAREAREIVSLQPYVFEFLGYECDPDETLDPAQADQNWLQLQLSSVREHLLLERAKRKRMAHDLEQSLEAQREEHERHKATWGDRDRVRQALHDEHERHKATWSDRDRICEAIHDQQEALSEADLKLAVLQTRFDTASQRLATFDEIAPGFVQVARHLTRITTRLRTLTPPLATLPRYVPRPHLRLRRDGEPIEEGSHTSTGLRLGRK